MARMRSLRIMNKKLFDRNPRSFESQRAKASPRCTKGRWTSRRACARPTAKKSASLMCGYFKSHQALYQPHNFHVRDIAFAAHQLDVFRGMPFNRTSTPETTRLRHPMSNPPNSHGLYACMSVASQRAGHRDRHNWPGCTWKTTADSLDALRWDFLIQRHVQVPTARAPDGFDSCQSARTQSRVGQLMDSEACC